MYFLLALAFTYASPCIQYSCKSHFNSFPPGQCLQSIMTPNNLSIALKVCMDEYISYCPPVLSNATCSLPPSSPTVNIAVIGEPCQLDENCLDSLCTHGFCMGLGANKPCQRDTQCNVGFFCSGVCTAQLAANNSCIRDEMCMNNFACQSGICTTYYSVPAQAEVLSCINNENFLCTSGACRVINGQNKCVTNSTSGQALPISCGYDSQCLIVLDADLKENYTTGCTCAQNGLGVHFCGLAPGDQVYLNYSIAMKKWLGSKQVNSCHTTRRTNLNCVQTYWDYEDYVTLGYFMMYALNYPIYQYSDNCVQKVYQKTFRNLQEQYLEIVNKSKTSGAIMTAVIISLFYF